MAGHDAVQRTPKEPYFIYANQCRVLENIVKQVENKALMENEVKQNIVWSVPVGNWNPKNWRPNVIRPILSRCQSLLYECSIEDPDSWLERAVKREESKEYFSLVVQELIEAVSSGFVLFSKKEDSLLHFLQSARQDLPLEAAKDRRDLLARVNKIIKAQSNHEEGEVELARFLQRVLKAKTIEEEKKARQIIAESLAEYGKTLGDGGSAKVVRASWNGVRGFAMKENRVRHYQEKEVNAMLGNRHANVMPMIAHSSEPPSEEGNERSMVLMEEMDGDLDKYLSDLSKTGKRTLHSEVDALVQIARGVEHLHENKIAHRDLKPGNILSKKQPAFDGVDDPERRSLDIGLLESQRENAILKIADFGSSRSPFDHRTVATAPIGTVMYMAPETLCVRGDKHKNTSKYGPEVDIYSFGMICYKVLTGQDPSVISWQDVLQGKRPPLKASASCPQALVSFIHKCWHQDPNERPCASQVYEFLNLFKYMGLLTTPAPETSCLSYGITDALLEKLVSFLGQEWLEAEARALKEGTSEDDKKLWKQVTEFLSRISKKSLIQQIVSFIL